MKRDTRTLWQSAPQPAVILTASPPGERFILISTSPVGGSIAPPSNRRHHNKQPSNSYLVQSSRSVAAVQIYEAETNLQTILIYLLK